MTYPALPRPTRRCRAEAAALLLALAAAPAAAARAQDDAAAPRCRALCAPTITLMPGVLRTHLLRGPVVRSTATGAQRRLAGSTTFEAVVAVASRTAPPRLGVFGSVQWLPNATEARNPFTLYTASELGAGIHANAPTATAGASVTLPITEAKR